MQYDFPRGIFPTKEKPYLYPFQNDISLDHARYYSENHWGLPHGVCGAGSKHPGNMKGVLVYASFEQG